MEQPQRTRTLAAHRCAALDYVCWSGALALRGNGLAATLLLHDHHHNDDEEDQAQAHTQTDAQAQGKLLLLVVIIAAATTAAAVELRMRKRCTWREGACKHSRTNSWGPTLTPTLQSPPMQARHLMQAHCHV